MPVIIIGIVIMFAVIVYQLLLKLGDRNKRAMMKQFEVDRTSVEPKPLLCYDCKYCIKRVEFGKDDSKCSKVMKNPEPDRDYLVTGKMSRSGDALHDKYYYCSTHRNSSLDTSMCQAEAKFFEPKVVQEKTNE